MVMGAVEEGEGACCLVAWCLLLCACRTLGETAQNVSDDGLCLASHSGPQRRDEDRTTVATVISVSATVAVAVTKTNTPQTRDQNNFRHSRQLKHVRVDRVSKVEQLRRQIISVAFTFVIVVVVVA